MMIVCRWPTELESVGSLSLLPHPSNSDHMTSIKLYFGGTPVDDSHRIFNWSSFPVVEYHPLPAPKAGLIGTLMDSVLLLQPHLLKKKCASIYRILEVLQLCCFKSGLFYQPWSFCHWRNIDISPQWSGCGRRSVLSKGTMWEHKHWKLQLSSSLVDCFLFP